MNLKENKYEIYDILKKLDILIGILAIQNKDLLEQVRILRFLEYTVPEIAEFTGISKRSVDNKIAELKRNKKIKK